jgi:hypothetical protein
VISQLQRNGFPLLPLQPSGGPVDLELIKSLREDGVLASLELIATDTSGGSRQSGQSFDPIAALAGFSARNGRPCP